jgi:tetratricopeptide (TPR) repeat protein
MTPTTGGAPSLKPAARPRSRRALAVALLLGVAVAVAGWYAWRHYNAPVPPDVPLADADPAVVEAVEAALQKARQQPYSAEAWGRLGKVLRAADYMAPAAVCFGHAEDLDPRNLRWPYLRGEALLQRGDPDAALPHLRRAVQVGERARADLFAPELRLAEALLAAGQYDEAEAHLRRAGEVEPDHPVVHLDLGILAYQRDDLPVSRDHLQRCQHSPFTQHRASAQLAVVCERLGDRAAAAQFSQRAGTLPRDMGWSDPFVMECLKLAAGKPGRFRYVEQLEAHGRLREAVEILREMADEGPDARVQVGLGKNLGKLGDYRGSEEALRAATRVAPDSVQAHYYLAKVLWTQGEQHRQRDERDGAVPFFRKAADEARRALAGKPDHAMAHMLLGLCLKQMGERERAVAELRTAVACGPELPDPYLHLGEALVEAGQVAEARPLLEQARSMAPPNDPRAREALQRLDAVPKPPG